MAVGKCKECGGQVASSAKACPHCGAKVSKKVGVLGWIFVLFVVLPIAWSIGTSMDSADKEIARRAISSTSPPQPATVIGWRERSYVDELTDQRASMLSLTSSNSSAFDFPYKVPGGSYLHLTFRERGGNLDAFFTIDKGHMLCGIRDCKFSIRIGEGPVQAWTGAGASTHESDIMFVRDARQFEEIIKLGERLRVGIDFYQAGTHVFEFDTKGYPGFK